MGGLFEPITVTVQSEAWVLAARILESWVRVLLHAVLCCCVGRGLGRAETD
jgi:hypothetical protein